MRRPRRSRTLCMIMLAAGICASNVLAQDGAVTVYRDNPRYWEYRGAPVLLLGGADQASLFNDPERMIEHLDELAGAGGNYIRCTLSSRDDGNLWPYVLEDAGQYNLERFNIEYWDRLDRFLREADRRGIVVQLDIWATGDYYRDAWLRNPFNPDRNSNFTIEDSSLEYKWEYHPAQSIQPFFLTVPALNDDSMVRAFQEAFVRQVLDVTGRYPHVLYCIDTETRAPSEWTLYWARFIQAEGQRRGRTFPVTEQWDQWDITAPEYDTALQNPELFAYIEVSPNSWQEGQVHYERLRWMQTALERLSGGQRPLNSIAVHDRRGRSQSSRTEICIDRWWQNIFAGCAASGFDGRTNGIGLNRDALRAIRSARIFSSVFGVFMSEPRPDLLSDRDENEAYCLAIPGQSYAVYFPSGGQVDLEVYPSDVGYAVRWLDGEEATFTDLTEREVRRLMEPSVHPGRELLELETPDDRNVWIALVEVR